MSKLKLIVIYWSVFAVLFATSFLPWAFYNDLNINFTGFYSYQNSYGKPAILLIITTFFNGILLFSSALWARYVSLGFGSIFFAYGIRTFYLYSSCHNGNNCPSVKIGLWLMIISTFALFILSLNGKVRKQKK